jgi:chromosome segregation ATPase
MIDALETVGPENREAEKNALTLKLERHQNDLSQLRRKLNSYICEPTTYSLFERMESLKHALEKLRRDNAEIIAGVKGHKRNMEDYIGRIKQQFIQFNQLQQGIDDYIDGARHC